MEYSNDAHRQESWERQDMLRAHYVRKYKLSGMSGLRLIMLFHPCDLPNFLQKDTVHFCLKLCNRVYPGGARQQDGRLYEIWRAIKFDPILKEEGNRPLAMLLEKVFWEKYKEKKRYTRGD